MRKNVTASPLRSQKEFLEIDISRARIIFYLVSLVSRFVSLDLLNCI